MLFALVLLLARLAPLIALDEQHNEAGPYFYSSGNSDGFKTQLKLFRKRLDPDKTMVHEDFYPQKNHTIHKAEDKVYWRPVECYHYGFEFHSRLIRVRELVSGGHNRVILMKDTKTLKYYVLKVYGDDGSYTAELGLGRLKGPYFVTPICTLTVRLPIKIGSCMDPSDYEDASNYIWDEKARLRKDKSESPLEGSGDDKPQHMNSTEHQDQHIFEIRSSLESHISLKSSCEEKDQEDQDEDSDVQVSITLGAKYQNGAKYKFVTRPAILMEYVNGVSAATYAYKIGESLKDFPSMTSASCLEAHRKLTNLFAEIFVALTQIHAIDAVYHDLKPENLLVVNDHLVMTDFDLMSWRTAPYRGSTPTTAPEQWQVLKGPLHGGVDFWAYGATCAILMANLCAGIYSHKDLQLAKVFQNYSPFQFNRKSMVYVMMPLPDILGKAAREFLYPFFSPDPDARQFNTIETQQKIMSMEFFCDVDWHSIYNPSGIGSQFPSMTMEEIWAYFLKESDKTFGDIESVDKKVKPQMLYRYEDEMSVSSSDKENSPLGLVLPSRKCKVAELVGIRVGRRNS